MAPSIKGVVVANAAGSPQDLADQAGQVLLLVNVARTTPIATTNKILKKYLLVLVKRLITQFSALKV